MIGTIGIYNVEKNVFLFLQPAICIRISAWDMKNVYSFR
jgi:hypothetical protein